MTHYLYVPSHSSLTEKWIQELEQPVKKQECWCEWITALTWLQEIDSVPGFVLRQKGSFSTEFGPSAQKLAENVFFKWGL